MEVASSHSAPVLRDQSENRSRLSSTKVQAWGSRDFMTFQNPETFPTIIGDSTDFEFPDLQQITGGA
jgi:hypothetical protein